MTPYTDTENTGYTSAEGYKLSASGIIISPSKFEGEQRYLPHFWDIYMDGGSDDEVDADDVLVSTVEVDRDDVALFPELAGRKVVRFAEDDNGFVYEVV
jgi:hypothetical protein